MRIEYSIVNIIIYYIKLFNENANELYKYHTELKQKRSKKIK